MARAHSADGLCRSERQLNTFAGCYDAFVDMQVAVDHLFQAEAANVIQTVTTDLFAMGQRASDDGCSGRWIGRIEVDGGVASDFGHGFAVRGKHGAAAGLGLDDRPAEAFL